MEYKPLYVCDVTNRKVYCLEAREYPKAFDKYPDWLGEDAIEEKIYKDLEQSIRVWDSLALFEDVPIRAWDGNLYKEKCLMIDDPYNVEHALTLGGIEGYLNNIWPEMEGCLKDDIEELEAQNRWADENGFPVSQPVRPWNEEKDHEDEPWQIACKELSPEDFEFPEWYLNEEM